MSNENVFEKKHGEDKLLNDVSGVLDHLNLPPAFVEFVRKNMRTVQIVLALVVVLTVFFSFYGSYREKKIDRGTQDLANAVNLTGDEKVAALENVKKEYSGDGAAVWAEVELAHEALLKKEYAKAAELYIAISNDAGKSSPLYLLAIYGAAQAEEGADNLSGALTHYEMLKNQAGYESVGFAGVARIQQRNKEYDKALATYQLYLGELADYPSSYPEKILVEEKIAKLKAITQKAE